MNAPASLDRATLLGSLENGLRKLSLEPAGPVGDRLLDYLDLLLHWNRAFNLTSITDPQRMLTHHLLDSLSIAQHIHGRRLLDVGSGAGLPGIPLALWFPDREIHLLDSNGKKTRFLVQARHSLGLTNVTVHHCRAEELRDDEGFDCVLARAVGTLADLISMTSHLLSSGGELLAMKAAPSDEELQGVTAPYNVRARSARRRQTAPARVHRPLGTHPERMRSA
jgi:16S rRNA (guanine527-N7)-methyltransferase